MTVLERVYDALRRCRVLIWDPDTETVYEDDGDTRRPLGHLAYRTILRHEHLGRLVLEEGFDDDGRPVWYVDAGVRTMFPGR
ncbi:MAG: hypothetical protein D6746_04495 [Bacteroidetes bacterium]|nr:MAG: hypothetical protein D6746_04495 [Bacteroidota bacterium]